MNMLPFWWAAAAAVFKSGVTSTVPALHHHVRCQTWSVFTHTLHAGTWFRGWWHWCTLTSLCHLFLKIMVTMQTLQKFLSPELRINSCEGHHSLLTRWVNTDMRHSSRWHEVVAMRHTSSPSATGMRALGCVGNLMMWVCGEEAVPTSCLLVKGEAWICLPLPPPATPCQGRDHRHHNMQYNIMMSYDTSIKWGKILPGQQQQQHWFAAPLRQWCWGGKGPEGSEGPACHNTPQGSLYALHSQGPKRNCTEGEAWRGALAWG